MVYIDLEDIFYSVFKTTEIKKCKVMTGWKNDIKASAKLQEIPEGFYHKTWEEIYQDMKVELYEANLLFFWFKLLKKELEKHSVKVLITVVNKNTCYMRIWWEE